MLSMLQAGYVALLPTTWGFAQPQPCPLTEAQAQQVFSLQSVYPEYFEEGTELMEEVDAAYDFFM